MNAEIVHIDASDEILFHIQKRTLSEKIDYNALTYGDRERIFLFSSLIDSYIRSQLRAKHTDTDNL